MTDLETLKIEATESFEAVNTLPQPNDGHNQSDRERLPLAESVSR